MRTPQPTLYDIEPGDRLLIRGGPPDLNEWNGPVRFTVTVAEVDVTPFGWFVQSHERINNGNGSTINTFYVDDGWIIETEEGIEIAK